MNANIYTSIWCDQDCGSFAGAINWVDCDEGPDSCYAYVEDDCVYTGERIGEWGWESFYQRMS